MRKKVLNAAKDIGYVPALVRSSGSRRRRARRQRQETDGYVDDADSESNENSGEYSFQRRCLKDVGWGGGGGGRGM